MAFWGPNGAGKSHHHEYHDRLLVCHIGDMCASTGTDIFEEPEKAKKLIGYLPEQPPLYPNETPLEYLRFVGEAKGLRGEELERQIRSVTAQARSRRCKTAVFPTSPRDLSKGWALRRLFWETPTSLFWMSPRWALTPFKSLRSRALIKELGEHHTVIFSSHILSEAQNICDQILIISKGRLVAFDCPDNLEKQMLRSSEITLTTEASQERPLRFFAGSTALWIRS